ncbi:NAD(P)-dependent oxidoreductase [Lonepinella sp. BR2930]|uniref:NAD(P)-dependent oxidoreductase n=1 Tax=Lonepinella sp. BR2930 TaxID=3434554 RepID=UPI003F6E175D
MKKNVILYKNIPEEKRKILEQEFNLFYFDGINEDNIKSFLIVLKIADGIIGASKKIPKEWIEQAPNLKAISTISVGYDNFDLDILNQRNIRLMHTPDVLTDTTADTIFMLLLMTARRAVELSLLIKEKKWNKSIGSQYYGNDVHHKTIGIVGMGRIGKSVAQRAFCGFNMKIIYTSNRRNTEAEQLFQATYASLDELLIQSDFVCLTLPLLPTTEKLISKEKINLMKSSAVLINASRGKIVDEKALIEALKNKTIKAAGLDVFEVEPLPFNSPLLALDNVVLLPHIGSATQETRNLMVDCAIDNLIMALKPEKPKKNLVNITQVS